MPTVAGHVGCSAVVHVAMRLIQCPLRLPRWQKGQRHRPLHLSPTALLELDGIMLRSRTPSPSCPRADWRDLHGDRCDELFAQFGLLLMMSTEEQWEYSPGTVTSGEDCFPALCDDGASFDASCARSLRGALCGAWNHRSASYP